MSKKVLTVDDSKTLRMIIGKHLTPFGVEMLQAENGEQGIASARQNSPDLILLDYNMPVMDGYHTLVELKTDPTLKSIPVVMLTTETVKETVVKLVKLGLKDYIAKPFTREVLLEKLNPILGLYDENGGQPEKGVSGVQDLVTNPENPTILIVDDKSNILDMLKDFLGGQYNIFAAGSGKAAISAINLKSFEYMILDLSMPEVSGFEVLESYIKCGRKGFDIRKVIAMTLRTAQEDINKAMRAGVSVFLYKPFSREDVANAIERVASHQKQEEKKKIKYLTSKGKIRILECPPETNMRYREVAGALKSGIMDEINEMAEEGLSQLIITVGDGFLSDMGVTRKFIALVEHIVRLSLNIKLVADSDQARSVLEQFAETASIPRESSLECALSSIE